MGGRRGGGRLRCLGPIFIICEIYEILLDPEEYLEHETEPWENKPPVIFTPMGPIDNPVLNGPA